MHKAVDIIIPTYRPGREFVSMISSLLSQRLPPACIIIVNTDRKAWEKHGYLRNLKGLFPPEIPLVIRHIEPEDFDHGASRNLAVSLGKSPCFVCMTQDALPADKNLLSSLTGVLEGDVGMSYARQLPRRDADCIEAFTRSYNYPGEPLKKRESDRERLGIKTYFASNVCAAYDRETFERLGGFREGLILNEDMLYAHDLLKEGGAVSYVPEARVFHSHSYGPLRQLKRNFDIAVSQKQAPEVFSGLKSEGEGIRLVQKTAAHLMEKRALGLLPYLFFLSGFKYLGFFLGRQYRRLPKGLVKRFSMNRKYWEKRYDFSHHSSL